MGKKSNEILYAFPDPHSSKQEGETQVYKSALLEENDPISEFVDPDVDTLKKTFIASVNDFGKDAFLGSREIVEYENEQPVYGGYNFKTYEEVYRDVIAYAKSLVSKKLFSETLYNKKKYKLIGIYAKNCEGWFITDLACCMSGLATVTLYDTLGHGSISYIIQQAELNTVVCTSDHIADLIKNKSKGDIDTLENLIILDN